MIDKRRRNPITRDGARAAVGVGSPLAVIVVWALNTYLLPAPMPEAVSAAVVLLVLGSVTGFAQRKRR
jgi:hypothetical protein